MTVMDLLREPITAGQIVTLLGDKVTSRTVRKARKGEPAALDRVGALGEVEIDGAKLKAMRESWAMIVGTHVARAELRKASAQLEEAFENMAACEEEYRQAVTLFDYAHSGKDVSDELKAEAILNHREATILITKAGRLLKNALTAHNACRSRAFDFGIIYHDTKKLKENLERNRQRIKSRRQAKQLVENPTENQMLAGTVV